MSSAVDELRARNRLNTVGGAQYLGEITDYLPTLGALGDPLQARA